ncbi:MAG: AAA family ATPase [Candidatus Cohnella colombiensis]|uniref:AAA family ATPase n=1 Tax=Candidatus Cohnella colombiensis TaxID=3121368 RepID=A0AA95JDX7_9BACL|nr:MAG: AAA family ATPase [Cohnella sp.]
MDSKWHFILETFQEIQQDLRPYLDKQNEKVLRYHIFRAIRCLGKAESLLEQTLMSGSPMDAKQGWKVVKKLRSEIGAWHVKLAEYDESKGDYNRAMRAQESALISNPSDPDFYLQYAHFTLKSNGLFPNQELEECLMRLSKPKAYDALTAMKSAKLSLQTYIGLYQSNEMVLKTLTWIEQLEIEISVKFPELNAQSEEQKTVEQVRAELSSLIGLDTVKNKINDAVNWLSFNKLRREQGFQDEPISMHMIFAGNPGTGKTMIARLLAELYRSVGFLDQGHLVEVDRSQLVAEYVGQTAIKTMNKVQEAIGGVLFIDEAYSLTRSQGNDFGVEAVDTIVKAMEDFRGQFIVILAGYPDEMQQFLSSNPGLHSRFKNQILFPDYTIDEMMLIGDVILEKKQFRMKDEAKSIFKRIIDDQMRQHPEQHGNGRLVRNIVEEAILNKATSVVSHDDGRVANNLDLLDERMLLDVEQEMNPLKLGIGYE